MADIPKEGLVLYRMEMTLGDKIRAAREELGMDQLDLANKLHVEPPTVSRWENNVIRPRAKRLKAIADMLEKPVSWFQENNLGMDAIERRLRELEDKQPTSQSEHNLLLIPDLQRLWAAWEGVGKEKWRRHVALFFLTGEYSHLEHEEISKEFRKRLLAGLEFHRMMPTAKARSPKKQGNL